MPAEFIELAGKVNQQMPYHCVAKLAADAQRPRPRGQRRAHRAARRQLQAGRRRHPRVAGAQDHRAAARARGRGRLPRSARRRARGVGLRSLPFEEALRGADCAVIVTAQPRRRLRRGRRGRAVPARPARRDAAGRGTWCGCERGRARGRRARLLGPEPRAQRRSIPGARLAWCCDPDDGCARAARACRRRRADQRLARGGARRPRRRRGAGRDAGADPRRRRRRACSRPASTASSRSRSRSASPTQRRSRPPRRGGGC